jgi:4-amino-4-deoxy-L-arabinose transferase-like glycosyltransferase
VLLHLNGEPYEQKPPLYFWLAAAAGEPFGRVTELAARLPSALAGIGLVALTLALGTRLLGGTSAALGTALLLTTWTFAEQARRAQLDVLLALFETLALAAFWRVDRGIGRVRVNQGVLHAALGLAVLTKGPVGFVVPSLVIAAYLAWEGRLRQIGRAFPWWGFGLSLGPGALWLAAAAAVAPGSFFQEAVVENVWARFAEGSSHARPFFYYLYKYPIELLPWTWVLPVAVWAGLRDVFAAGAIDDERRRAWRFLVGWVGASLLFFSISTGKRGLYVLPTLPASALLAGDSLRVWAERARRIPGAYHVVTGILGAAVVAACVWLGIADPLRNRMASIAVALVGSAIAIGTAGAALALHRMRAPLAARLAAPVAGVLLLELVGFVLLLPAIDGDKSPRALAEAAAALTPPGTPIGLVEDRSLVGGIAYYGGRPVAELREPESVRRFLADGGRAIVVKERKLGRVEVVTPVQIHFRTRRGRRAMLVVTPQRVEGD